MSKRAFTIVAFLLTAFANPAISYDSNSNNMSDVWEQLYNKQNGSLRPNKDNDRDGFNNYLESIAGTDPHDVNDYPMLSVSPSPNDTNSLIATFKTHFGKEYTVSESQNLIGYDDLYKKFIGDGAERVLNINTLGNTLTSNPIEAYFWADISPSSISDLQSLETFPKNPDGTIQLPEPEAPSFKATGYGARITFWITPQRTGPYTFFLSAGGPSQLYLGNINFDGAQVIAEILPDQNNLQEEEWETYGSQRSKQIDLIKDKNYFFELHYVSNQPNQHVQIGWSGPGLNGIEKLDRDDLSDVIYLSKYFSGKTLFEHNYDSKDSSGVLWPANTKIVSGPSGMPGKAEHMTGAPGKHLVDELVLFDKISKNHLYASWLFNFSDNHTRMSLIFLNENEKEQEGPRIIFTKQKSQAFLEVTTSTNDTTRLNINFDETYRAEIVSSLANSGYRYSTPHDSFTVKKDTFDLYISNSQGDLVASARGLSFIDGLQKVKQFSAMRAAFTKSPNILFDEWEVTNGSIVGNGYLVANQTEFGNNGANNFFQLKINELDQDKDGLSDWEELILASNFDFLFFDPKTVKKTKDVDYFETLINNTEQKSEISLYCTDAAAYESNFPNLVPDHGEITISRTGGIGPLTVNLRILPLADTGNTATVCDGTCCLLIGSAGDEAAESADYQLIDEDGNVITSFVDFGFGETSKILTVKAINDEINEYPETLNLAVAKSSNGDYSISSSQNGASIQLFDLPDNPDNRTIFTGTFSKDGRATTNTSASGFFTATLNGPRTEMYLWTEYSNLTSAQQDAHIHKANQGTKPSKIAGNIVYGITKTPGDESSDPKIFYKKDPTSGALEEYPWDLTTSPGVIPTNGGSPSKQAIIDSLFGQNDETSLYFNIHSINNPAGEIWAFLTVSGGSQKDPGNARAAATPGSRRYPMYELGDWRLEADVRRFLNQATFGATEEAVSALMRKITLTRNNGNPDYHRHEAFEDWIDNQMNRKKSGQTYLTDYMLASSFQQMVLIGIFDPSINPSSNNTSTPTRPQTWPYIVRNNSDPNDWYLSSKYPVSHGQFKLAEKNKVGLDHTKGWGEYTTNTLCQIMLNAQDQLRQKMGFALQQICVVSTSLETIKEMPYAISNYQDQINYRAFDYYRDVLGFVNWNPLMALWLSSLQNQKAVDFDGDGIFDAFPDENLARENMQLFSIGLFEKWPDGTLKLTTEGLPKSTYTNQDIREFARILTGQSFAIDATRASPPPFGQSAFSSRANNTFSLRIRSALNASSYSYPMKMFGEFHSLGPKTFAGKTIDNTHILDLDQQGTADIESAIDWLAGIPGDGKPDYDMKYSHVSTPYFISYRLIQRFVTSNPSKNYLHRVATTFKNSEGHLGETLKAILLDPEARHINLTNSTFGLKKSPLESYFQLLRALDAHTYIPLENSSLDAEPYNEAPGNLSNPDLYLTTFGYPESQLSQHERNVRFMESSFTTNRTHGLQMSPFNQETVFNFYLPDYSPNGPIGQADLVAPEMQLANESDIIRNINFLDGITRYEMGHDSSKLAVKASNQEKAFNSAKASDNHRSRLPRRSLVDQFYPKNRPKAQNNRTSESLADEALVDELDKRLTNGLFKIRYPYDSSDNDDPAQSGADDLLKNPREIIIDMITDSYNDPYDGLEDQEDRLQKFSDALYLLTISPEYQIKK